MKIIEKICDKCRRNVKIYFEAYKKGRIAGFDYTLLLWKNHTKFLLRLRNPKDSKAEMMRMNKFAEGFISVIKPYQTEPIYQSPLSYDSKDSNIWIYWNNPYNMPVMVKQCIERIRKNCNGHKVIVVTDDTFSEFLQLDDVVLRKYKEGKISRTHFSDILRVSLLYYYGGVWMDSTLLLTQPLPEIVTSSPFYTNHLNKWDETNASGGRWSSFFIACHKGNLMMKAARDVFVEYWHRYDYLVDYVWIDYVFNLLYDNIPSIREMIDAVPENNPDIWMMQMRIADAFSQEEFDAMLADDSRFLHKFSYKSSVDAPCYDEKGNMTLKGRLCAEYTEQQ